MGIYDEKPWLQHYDPGVKRTLEPYPDVPLQKFLQDAAMQHPEHPALITDAVLPVLGHVPATLTYGDLNAQSDALACALLGLGLKKGDTVALVMPNVAQFAISYYGVLKAGGVVAATNPTYPPDKMAFQINDCDAKIVITLTLFYNVIKQIQPKTQLKTVIATNVKEALSAPARVLFTLAKEKKGGHRVEALASGDHWLGDLIGRYLGQKPNVTVKGSDLALFQYTGGTTGVSKAAMAQHRALVANTLQAVAWTTVSEGELADKDRSQFVYLGALPLFHVFGLLVMLSQAMSTGARIVLVPNPRDVDALVEIIAHYKPNVFLGVPAMFNAVNNHARVKSGEVRFNSVWIAQSGAAPLPPTTKKEFEAAGAKLLYEGYGMSEMPTATHNNPIIGVNKVGTVGMPLPDVECKIVSLDDGVTEMPVGEIGEIIMRGPNMMTGYYKMPTETANTLRVHGGKHWVYSGDIGYMDADGYFTIVDRKKDMALIGGFNVYPNTVEKALKEHPAVLEVGVAAVPHETKEGQETLKAWIVLKEGASLSTDELIKHCETRLAPYEVPRRFSFIKELPKSTVGKTLRRELVLMEMSDRERPMAD